MPVHIRFATVADADDIARFQILMAKETEDKDLIPTEVCAGVQAVFADRQKGFYLVGELEERIAGCLLITYEWSDWRNLNQWYIQSAFVEEPFRGKGIFKQLFQFVIDQARASGVRHVRLYVETENKPAQGVYESLAMIRLPYYMYDFQVEPTSKS